MTATRPETLRINDQSTRPEIALAIAALMTKMRRLPAHWVDQRAAISDEVDGLVDLWLSREVS